MNRLLGFVRVGIICPALVVLISGCQPASPGQPSLFVAQSGMFSAAPAAAPAPPVPAAGTQPVLPATQSPAPKVSAEPKASGNTISLNIVDACQGGGNNCEYDSDEYRGDLQTAIASALTARGESVVPPGNAARILTVTITALGENESDAVSDLCGSLCDAASSQIATVNYQLTDSTGDIVVRNTANASASAVTNFSLDALFQQLSNNIVAGLPP